MRFETQSTLSPLSLEMCKMTGRETLYVQIFVFVEVISCRETGKVKGC